MTEQERENYKGKFYKIEVLYLDDSSVCKHSFINRTSGEVMHLRETFFSAGVGIQKDPGTWDIIMPMNLKKVTVTLQKKYFTY